MSALEDHTDLREAAAAVLDAHGLVLEEVGYPADDQLTARQREARARRDEGEA